MTRLQRLLTCTGLGVTLLLAVRSSDATTVVALSDAELACGAKTVLHGDVVSRESFVTATGGRIYTEYRFAVRDLLKGAAESDGTVVFREWGGEVGGTHYWLPGVSGYKLGEEVVAFLGDADPRTGVGLTYGLAQGKFVVQRDAKTGKAEVRRDLSGLKLVDGDRQTPAPEPPDEGAGRELESFKAKIRTEAAK
jgi:hypothetical protein